MYWITPGLRRLFETLPKLEEIARPRQGLATADNSRFLRYWWEVGPNSIGFGCKIATEAKDCGKRWFPYMKGGAFQRWYGNQEYVVNWEGDGQELDAFRPTSVIRNKDFYFRQGVTWTLLSAKGFSSRLSPGSFIFDVNGMTCFPDDGLVKLILAMMNSKVCSGLLSFINPTIAFQVGDLSRLPVCNFSYPAMADTDGILMIDEGHADDLPAKVLQALNAMVGEKAAEEIVKAATEKEGNVEDLLRQYLDRQFFKLHIQQYCKRPVYWFLQSPKKKYGIWVFHEKLNKDSLFRIRTEYVEPKINLLKNQIRDLTANRDAAEGRERRALEKESGNLVDILDDVREFLKRLNFIIEERGYVPRIDDGVLLNMAPLWELIPSWQKEPKKAWEALERGDYDWAYQAMDHWPDRVKEKCRTNKSFAIAHGLEKIR